VTLEKLQYLIYELGRRLQLKEVHVIGSAAIAATVPTPPEGELTATRDVDVIPPNDDERAMDAIDLYMGEGSALDEATGYYAHGVSSKTPQYAPRNWKQRTVDVATRTAVGHCMDMHDLVVSKLGAGREKDLRFAGELAKLGLLKRETLLERLESVDCPDELRKLIAERIAGLPYVAAKQTP
jgi:hypothetical protein